MQQPDGKDSDGDDAKHDVDGNLHDPTFATLGLLGLHRLEGNTRRKGKIKMWQMGKHLKKMKERGKI